MILVLIGQTASGKTTVRNILTTMHGFKKIVTYTTRPKRRGEIDGVDYNFLPLDTFEAMESMGMFAEVTEYNADFGYCKYGSSIYDYRDDEKDKVVVLNPEGAKMVKEVAKEEDLDVCTIMLSVPEEVLLERARSRGDKMREVKRRLKEDKQKFKDAEAITDFKIECPKDATRDDCAFYVWNAFESFKNLKKAIKEDAKMETPRVTVQPCTTENPIELIGLEAGICWGTDTSDPIKNFNRGVSCIKANHGRTLEFPQVYLTIDGYSARCIRELYTHIAGGPTRLQASTRYINYSNFDYIVPDYHDDLIEHTYHDVMDAILTGYSKLISMGMSKEDAANVLPLGMTTKIVIRTNLRHLIDMMAVRQCSRAYWEMQELMKEIKIALSEYSDQWKLLCNYYMPVKCERDGLCTEEHSCGRIDRLTSDFIKSRFKSKFEQENQNEDI